MCSIVLHGSPFVMLNKQMLCSYRSLHNAMVCIQFLSLQIGSEQLIFTLPVKTPLPIRYSWYKMGMGGES